MEVLRNVIGVWVLGRSTAACSSGILARRARSWLHSFEFPFGPCRAAVLALEVRRVRTNRNRIPTVAHDVEQRLLPLRRVVTRRPRLTRIGSDQHDFVVADGDALALVRKTDCGQQIL